MFKVTAIHLQERVNSSKLDSLPENHKLYLQLKELEDRLGSLMIEKIKADVRLVELDNGYAMVNDQLETVDYWVEYRRFKIFGRDTLFQSLVWSDRKKAWTGTYKGYSTFAAYVFYELLFPKSELVICSDQEQSRMGKAFWERRLGEAFQLGYHVYVVDTKPTWQVVSEVENVTQLAEIEHKVWGKERYHLRLIISKESLKS